MSECKVSGTEVSAAACNECGVCDQEETLRLRHALRGMMDAYERRIRSLCKGQAELDAQPWRCAEYINAERVLDS